MATAEAFICDAIRTPVGRYGGSLSTIRTDDLGSLPLKALMERNPKVDWNAIEDVVYGCVNQAGEDNRNVARMALLLAGLPIEVPAATVNRLCGSGLNAVGMIARAIKTGEISLAIAGGVESMTRAPFVLAKSDSAFSRSAKIEDTTIGWRFVNPLMKAKYGVDAMADTAENVAEEWKVSRADQDAFALRSQQRWAKANAAGFFKGEIIPVKIPQKKGDPKIFDTDEHPRPDTTLEKLTALKPAFSKDGGGTVTAGNASGVNDGAAALLLVEASRAKALGLRPIAFVGASASAGVDPAEMGIGPVPAIRKLMARTGLDIASIDLFEINEAFAAQSVACMRALGLDPARVNVNGGAIAIGHPLGASGARLAATLVHEMARRGSSRGIASLCVGVGQGLATLFERE